MNTKTKFIQNQITKHYGAFGDELPISPIGKIDIEIINELVELIKKYNNAEVAAIMHNYKKKPDYDIAEQLIDVNTNFEPIEMSEGEEKLPYWLHFNDIEKNRVQRLDVKKYKPIEIEKGNDLLFGILINEIESENIKNIPITADLKLIYYDEEERNADMEQLDNLANY